LPGPCRGLSGDRGRGRFACSMIDLAGRMTAPEMAATGLALLDELKDT
jgi:hypothetical protein